MMPTTPISVRDLVLALTPAAAVVGLLLTAAQFIYLSLKTRREMRQEQARFGFNLLDALFDDELASELLYALDESARPADRAQQLRRSFRDLFGSSTSATDTTSRSTLYQHVDALLYHFDRFEHAIVAKLIRFDDVKSPPGHYVRLMSKQRVGFEVYAADVGYLRAVAFLRRFD